MASEVGTSIATEGSREWKSVKGVTRNLLDCVVREESHSHSGGTEMVFQYFLDPSKIPEQFDLPLQFKAKFFPYRRNHFFH